MIEDFTLRARVSGFLNLQSAIFNLQSAGPFPSKFELNDSFFFLDIHNVALLF
jgi:hypothetical protein